MSKEPVSRWWRMQQNTVKGCETTAGSKSTFPLPASTMLGLRCLKAASSVASLNLSLQYPHFDEMGAGEVMDQLITNMDIIHDSISRSSGTSPSSSKTT